MSKSLNKNGSTLPKRIRRNRKPDSRRKSRPAPKGGSTRPPEVWPPEWEGEFLRILGLVDGGYDWVMNGYSRSAAQECILEHMALHGFRRPADYLQFLEERPAEGRLLRGEILACGPGFFFEPGTFEFFKSDIFDALWKTRVPDEPIRCWVPGCGTGADAYSFAICLLECLGPGRAHIPLRIYATDVNEDAIRIARLGWYPASIARVVSPARLDRFFTKSTRGYQIATAVREMIVFASHDHLRHAPLANLDFICCRNLIKWLKPAARQSLPRVFHFALKPKGLLFLGHSDPFVNLVELFSLVHPDQRIYAKKTARERFLLLPRKEGGSPVLAPCPKEGAGFPKIPAASGWTTADGSGAPEPPPARRRVRKSKTDSIFEKARATGEELALFQERLLASNLDLRRTQAALVSANQGLKSAYRDLSSTVRELRDRSAELDIAKSDLSGLLDGLNIPVILVDRQFFIRQMTPLALRRFHLTHEHIGRTLSSLNLPLPAQTLQGLVRQVFDTGLPAQRDLRDGEGCWFTLTVQPCRSSDGAFTAVVLSLVDVDAVKRSHDQLENASDLARAIVDQIGEPLAVLDSDLRIQVVNQAYGTLFGVSRNALAGVPFFGAGPGQWTQKRVRSWLSLDRPKRDGRLEVEYDFAGKGRRTVALSARDLGGIAGQRGVILLEVKELGDDPGIAAPADAVGEAAPLPEVSP